MPTMIAAHPYVENGPQTPIGTKAREKNKGAHPTWLPMKPTALKNRAFVTLTSRTSPEDWRTNRRLVEVDADNRHPLTQTRSYVADCASVFPVAQAFSTI